MSKSGHKDDGFKDDENSSDEENALDLGFEAHVQRMVKIRKKALKNIETAQDKQKKCYGAKHCRDKEKYKVGQLKSVRVHFAYGSDGRSFFVEYS